MNKYQVYLTNGDVIYIEAENFSTRYEYDNVRFIKEGRNIAIFILSNIYGFEEVDEFDDEEEENGNNSL